MDPCFVTGFGVKTGPDSVSWNPNLTPRYLGRETELAKLLLETLKGHGEISLKMWFAAIFINSTKTREGT